MVSTDDSDGCTLHKGQRGTSEQGGENPANSGGRLVEGGRELLGACLLPANHRL